MSNTNSQYFEQSIFGEQTLASQQDYMRETREEIQTLKQQFLASQAKSAEAMNKCLDNCTQLQEENTHLKEKLDQIDKRCKQLEDQIRKYQKERSATMMPSYNDRNGVRTGNLKHQSEAENMFNYGNLNDYVTSHELQFQIQTLRQDMHRKDVQHRAQVQKLTRDNQNLRYQLQQLKKKCKQMEGIQKPLKKQTTKCPFCSHERGPIGVENSLGRSIDSTNLPRNQSQKKLFNEMRKSEEKFLSDQRRWNQLINQTKQALELCKIKIGKHHFSPSN